MKRLLGLLLTCLMMINTVHAADPLPQVAVGRVERLANFPSRHVDARHVDVWLPRGYDPAVRHAVVYMHDGQMLFDAATTWNRQAWNVQDTLQRLIDTGRIPPTLVVGVWNNGKFRHSEYFPQKFLPGMPEPLRQRLVKEGLQGKPQSDAYLRFLVEELKPAIDARYATRREPAATVLMGSSMGGLISVYAMNEYPQVFGGAAGLSTHWVGTFQPNAAVPLAAFNYLRAHLADPATHRLYQDHGTTELDAIYAPYQVMVNDLARERGYVDGTHFETRVFEGTGHNETAWAARLEIPLLFLLGRR
jgi:enterochelin esterase-like enzyme